MWMFEIKSVTYIIRYEVWKNGSDFYPMVYSFYNSSHASSLGVTNAHRENSGRLICCSMWCFATIMNKMLNANGLNFVFEKINMEDML